MAWVKKFITQSEIGIVLTETKASELLAQLQKVAASNDGDIVLIKLEIMPMVANLLRLSKDEILPSAQVLTKLHENLDAILRKSGSILPFWLMKNVQAEFKEAGVELPNSHVDRLMNELNHKPIKAGAHQVLETGLKRLRMQGDEGYLDEFVDVELDTTQLTIQHTLAKLLSGSHYMISHEWMNDIRQFIEDQYEFKMKEADADALEALLKQVAFPLDDRPVPDSSNKTVAQPQVKRKQPLSSHRPSQTTQVSPPSEGSPPTVLFGPPTTVKASSINFD